MKKNVLTLAVAGAVAASAQAQMYVNSDNTGEVLIYPFYSADNGNQTYIHVVNTTEYAKAVKVRIHEAENSWEVRDFNLYLSEYDHFAFVIELDESGAGRLVTGDTSCTVPAIPEGGIEFTNLLYADEENSSLERTLNGYVEVIEMGQFSEAIPTNTAGTNGGPGYYWTHVNGVPRSCETVVGLWASGGSSAPNGPWYDDVFGSPSKVTGVTGALSSWQGGGLYGMGIIVNPEDGAAIGYDAVAIESFVTSTDAAALHYYPGDVKPGLSGRLNFTAESASVAVDGVVGVYTGTTRAGVTDTLDAVSALMMVDSISNDYVLDEFFAGSTDWVVTFPTKRLYVAGDGDTIRERAINPFYEEWMGDESCDPYGIQVWDREEQTPNTPQGTPPFSPYTPGKSVNPEICYEANVMTFAVVDTDADSPILGTSPSASGARIQTVVETPYANGWSKLDLDWDNLAAAITPKGHILPMSGGTLEGLPAVGFSVIAFGNDSLSGGSVLANYAAAHEHKADRSAS